MTERFSTANHALAGLAKEVMTRGHEVASRGGDRVLERMHQNIVLESPRDREILIPERKANIAAQIAETMWVLSGRDDIAWLSHYLPRAADFSDDGETWRAAYGPRMRAWPGWGGEPIDQLKEVIELLRRGALTRRAVISIFDPARDFIDSKDIPCNNWLAFSSRLGKLDLHVATRSNDLIWGWSGINQFEWSVLQEIVAGMTGVQVGELHFSINSLHVYDRHWRRALSLAKHAEEDAESDLWFTGLSSSPAFDASKLLSNDVRGLDQATKQWFEVEYQIRTSVAVDEYPALIAAIEGFPEPMMRSWLWALLWWWGLAREIPAPIAGTRLGHALLLSSGKPGIRSSDAKVVTLASRKPDAFAEYVVELQRGKSEAYGDSWKRRGEQISILANVARKVDRLGVTGGGDTATDTAVDLMTYLVMYRLWLRDERQEWTVGTNVPTLLAQMAEYGEQLLSVAISPELVEQHSNSDLEQLLTEAFSDLEDIVNDDRPRGDKVDFMIRASATLARRMWLEDQRQEVKKANEKRSWGGYDQ